MCYRKGFFAGFAIAGLSTLAALATAQGPAPGQTRKTSTAPSGHSTPRQRRSRQGPCAKKAGTANGYEVGVNMCDAQVGDPSGSVTTNQNVLWLEVTMDDTMRLMQNPGNN